MSESQAPAADISPTRWEFKHWFYKGYRRAFRPRKKLRKRRLTEKGQLIITGAVLTAALGLNTETSFVYQLFALLLCLAIASRIGLRIARPNIAVRRLLPRHVTAGETFHYRIRVDNLGDEVESDLTVSDIPKNQMPSLQQYQSSREPDEESRNGYDRFIGFHRFIYLQRQLTGIVTHPDQIEEIPRGGFREAEIEATPLRRGRVEFRHTIVLHQDPLALNYAFNHFNNPESLVVLPKRYQLSPNLQVAGGRNFQQGGITSAWSRGESDEFTSLRDYRDGDSMKKIHWASSAKQSARKQGLVVKEYQDEFFARNALIVDINSSAGHSVEEAVSVAASITMEQQHTDHILDLMFQDQDGTRMITADSSNKAGHEQLEALALLQPCERDFEKLTELCLLHMAKVTGCICVFADWHSCHESFVNQLRTRGTEVKCLVITETFGPYIRIRPSAVQQDLLAI